MVLVFVYSSAVRTFRFPPYGSPFSPLFHMHVHICFVVVFRFQLIHPHTPQVRTAEVRGAGGGGGLVPPPSVELQAAGLRQQTCRRLTHHSPSPVAPWWCCNGAMEAGADAAPHQHGGRWTLPEGSPVQRPLRSNAAQLSQEPPPARRPRCQLSLCLLTYDIYDPPSAPE